MTLITRLITYRAAVVQAGQRLFSSQPGELMLLAVPCLGVCPLMKASGAASSSLMCINCSYPYLWRAAVLVLNMSTSNSLTPW